MAGEGDLIDVNFGDDDDDSVIEVQLPGDGGGAAVVKVEGEKKDPPKVEGDDPLESLKSQFTSMTQRATAAEQAAEQARAEAQQATQRAAQMERQVVGSQLDTVLSGIAAAEAEAATAEQEYTAAFEAGDGAAMARAQRKMANAEARRLRLAEAKDDLEEAAKRQPDPPPKAAQQPAQPQQRGTGDPVEDFIRNARLTPRSAAFIRKHPETATDQRANARMLAAHNLAVADGIEVESDEYFQRIEEGISMSKKAPDPQPQQRTTRPSSAAASDRGSPSGGAPLNGGTVVTLTKREAQAATDGTLVWNYPDPTGQNRWKAGDPIGVAEMARRKMEGQKRGLYDRSFTAQ